MMILRINIVVIVRFCINVVSGFVKPVSVLQIGLNS